MKQPHPGDEGISFLELVCNRLDEQEKYYSEVMELNVKRVHPGKLNVQLGSTEINFYEEKAIEDPIYHFAINIPENQLEASIVWLERKKLLLADSPDGGKIFDFRNWNAHSIYWSDVSGNILEIIARHGLPNASKEVFSSGSMLYVSEIGLVVDDVQSQAKRIQDKLGLDPYKVSTDQFAALGNEHNLIILVTKNRPWLGDSSNKPARPYPVIARFNRGARNASMKFDGLPYTITTGKS